MSAFIQQVVTGHSSSPERQAEAEAGREAACLQQGPQISSGHESEEGNLAASSSSALQSVQPDARVTGCTGRTLMLVSSGLMASPDALSVH